MPCIVKYTTHTNASIRMSAIFICYKMTEMYDVGSITMMRSSLFNHLAALFMAGEEEIYGMNTHHILAEIVANVDHQSVEIKNSLFDYHLWPLNDVMMHSSNRGIYGGSPCFLIEVLSD